MLTQNLINAPVQNSAANTTSAEVVGNKTDTAAAGSLVGISRAIKAETDQIGTITNTGGAANLGAVLGDMLNLPISNRFGTLNNVLDKGGLQLFNGKSIVNVLGSDGNSVTDSAVSVLGAIGANNNNNAFDSTNVVSDANGSVMERAEYLQSNLGQMVNTGGNADLANIIGDANNVNLISRLTSIVSSIQEHGSGFLTTKAISYNGSASYNAFTITGAVTVQVYGIVDAPLSNVAATTSVGTATSPNGLIAGTQGSALQTVGNIWNDPTPSNFEMPALGNIIGGGEDIVVDGDATLVAGTVTLYCYWKPRSTGATVVPA